MRADVRAFVRVRVCARVCAGEGVDVCARVLACWRASVRMSVSARTLHELQDEGRRDAEDLLLAMQNEKDRQHAHMKAKLRARRESKKQLLKAKQLKELSA